MIVLIVFSFLAGIVTVLSPCILPLLPIILSSVSATGISDRKKPIGIVLGFIASFTFLTLFLSTIVNLTGISANFLRTLSVILIAVFGLSLLIPKVSQLLEQTFTRFSSKFSSNQNRTGFLGGILVGLSLGILWTPCVGPILASVISLAIVGSVSVNSFLIILSYSIGTAIPMFAILVGGQTLLLKNHWLVERSAQIQKFFGVIMILTAIAIFFRFDQKFQTWVLNQFPSYGTGLTKIEDNSLVKNSLQQLNANKTNPKDMGQPTYTLTDKGPIAPEIVPGGQWFNSPPLTIKSLRGKVVLIDFWTYSCINCQRTIPYVKSWWEKYKDKGLVIIGVHSPEFEFEKDPKNVSQQIKGFGITYPVVQDNNFTTWQAYKNQYWPAKYLIDKDGIIRYTHFGEMGYDETEKKIQELLAETGEKDVSMPINNPSYQTYAQTPETYLGYDRLLNFSSPEDVKQDVISTYSILTNIPADTVAYQGPWLITHQFANPQKGAKLFLNFNAKDVYLVMNPKSGSPKIKITVDNATSKDITIDEDKLYHLVNLETPGQHILQIEFDSNDVELFAFTFG